MNYKKYTFGFVLIIYFGFQNIHGMATTNYRPDLKLPETQLGKYGIQVMQATYAHGSASHSFDSFEKDTASVLATLGQQAFFRSDLARDASILSEIPSTTSFLGNVLLDGSLHINQFTFTTQTNIKGGLFFELYFLADTVTLKNTSIQDLFDSTLSDQVQTDLKEYFAQTYSKITKNTLTTTFAYTGWAGHYQDLAHIDFLDTTAKIGLVSRYNEYNMFTLSSEQFQDWGIPVSASVSMGLYDWITMGLHAGTIIFLPQTQNYEINSSTYDAVLFPEHITARQFRKPLITITPYIKADHVAGGLSVSFGFVYAQAFKSTYIPVDIETYSIGQLNAHTHTTWTTGNIHCMIEYDCATQHHPELPYIQLIYTQPVYGQHVAKTHLYGGTLGIIFKYTF